MVGSVRNVRRAPLTVPPIAEVPLTLEYRATSRGLFPPSFTGRREMRAKHLDHDRVILLMFGQVSRAG